MDETEWENESNCRLVRADGSEWRVRELRGGENGLRVDAVRAGPAAADGNAGEGEASEPGAAPRSRLEDELLGRGDRLQWHGEDGDVVWSMKLPMDQARSA